MGVKTVLDFPEIASPEDSDVLYAIRGASTGRDKRITWANLKQFLAPLAHAVATTIYGKATDVLYGHVRLNNAPTEGSTDGVSSGGVYSAIDNATTTLTASIDNTTTALTTAIGNEASARSSGDSGLQSQVNALTTAISTETDNRVSADVALQGQLDKLYSISSSSQQDVGSPGTGLFNDEIIDGACITVYPTFDGVFQLVIGEPPAGVKVFHVRLKLPVADTDYEQKLRMYYPSALDANVNIMTQYVQKRESDNAGYAQYSPVFTFMASGSGWILM